MKLKEAIATGTLFVKPLLYSEFDKRDKEAQNALFKLKKMKVDKKKYKSKKYLEKLLYYKSRIF